MQPLVSWIIAIVLMALWVGFLYEGRDEMRRTERLSYDFVLKWNVLPLLVALELVTTQSLIPLGVGAMAFFLLWPIAKLALAALPILIGLHVGTEWFSKFHAYSEQSVLIGSIVVAIVLTLVSQTIAVAMRRPPAYT